MVSGALFIRLVELLGWVQPGHNTLYTIEGGNGWRGYMLFATQHRGSRLGGVAGSGRKLYEGKGADVELLDWHEGYAGIWQYVRCGTSWH